MKSRLRHMLDGSAIALVLAIPTAHAADNVTLTETGSTLLYPLFQSWIAGYKSVASNIDLSAAAPAPVSKPRSRARPASAPPMPISPTRSRRDIRISSISRSLSRP